MNRHHMQSKSKALTRVYPLTSEPNFRSTTCRLLPPRRNLYRRLIGSQNVSKEWIKSPDFRILGRGLAEQIAPAVEGQAKFAFRGGGRGSKTCSYVRIPMKEVVLGMHVVSHYYCTTKLSCCLFFSTTLRFSIEFVNWARRWHSCNTPGFSPKGLAADVLGFEHVNISLSTGPCSINFLDEQERT
jgi:hypothetical protein